MARKVAIGAQSFSEIREGGSFLIDKTMFIKEWWDNRDSVTLITRPRRFGKTLNMNMLECFFSTRYENRSDLFEDLKIWDYEEYRKIQGKYPVISLSFAEIKNKSFAGMKENISLLFNSLYIRYNSIICESEEVTEDNKEKYKRIKNELVNGENENVITESIKFLSEVLSIHYKTKAIILLDEYDTPFQEAYVGGFWDEMISFMRLFFNSTFKSNENMYRAVLTGITRVSRESLFSDFNNPELCTLSASKYQDCFGFTEQEVFDAMDEFGYANKDEVKFWYDGFTIGQTPDIYNPWSVINFLDKNELKPYWSNTSSNALVGKLIREGSRKLKMDFEELLNGKSVLKEVDEEMVFGELADSQDAVWSLLAMSGYLCIDSINNGIYELRIVNHEVMLMFRKLIKGWFRTDTDNYSDFITGLLKGDLRTMNVCINELALSMFGMFDSGNHPSEKTAPERFYHGFVLGLMVELRERYTVTSNRESGLGRYDVILEPKDKENDDGIIFEFKVYDSEGGEKTLQDTASAALKQIEDMKYEQILLDHGIPAGHIRKYGFAFKGKKVLIGESTSLQTSAFAAPP